MTNALINLLLIEDNPGDVRLMRELLAEARDESFDLVWAGSMANGIERLAKGERIHLVLLDLSLPDSQGLDTFTSVYAWIPRLPIIVLSGLDDQDLAVRAVREGAQDYLVKGMMDSNLLCRAIRYAIERKRAEEALQDERNLLRTVMMNFPDEIFVKDTEGRFLIANAEVARCVGAKTVEGLIGRTDFDFFAPGVAAKFHEDEQAILASGQAIINRITTDLKDGERYILSTKVPLLNGQGNIIGLVGINRNITEQTRTEKKLTESLSNLRRAMESAVEAMAMTVEIRDPYTAGHQRRVAQLAQAIAGEMGLPGEQVEAIRLAAIIHDVGKISIPAEILSKPGRITEIEFNLIRTHPQVGYDILKTIEFPWPIAEIVRQHHRRLDGSGYPSTTPGDEIMLEARILGVADVVEAMSSHRPYRAALGVDMALEEVASKRGILYDPDVTESCLTLLKEKGFAFA